MTVAAADERAHEPDPSQPDWQEWWSFDFASAADPVGGFVRVALVPGRRTAWYWAYVVTNAPDVVVVRDHEVPVPRRANNLELRADALWAELVCETPFEHWGLALEAFGLRLDEPLDTLRGEIGERIAVGLDLEWECDDRGPRAVDAGYWQSGTMHGELLVTDARVPFEGAAVREHGWVTPPWRRGWRRTVWLPDGPGPERPDVPAEVIAAMRIPLDDPPARRSLVRELIRVPGLDPTPRAWSEHLETQ